MFPVGSRDNKMKRKMTDFIVEREMGDINSDNKENVLIFKANTEKGQNK